MKLFHRTASLLTAVALVCGLTLAMPVVAHAQQPGPYTDQQRQQNETFTDQQNIQKNNDPVSGKKVENTSVIDYVDAIYKWAAGIGGLLAILMLIYAGYRYMTSYGDPEKISDAKDIIEKALIGLALLILAATILNTINSRTAENPCKPGEPNCGSIDFSKPGG